MKFIKGGCVLVALLSVLSVLKVIQGNAEQQRQLPRSFGFLTLGMSAKAFQKITGTTPEFCPHCADDELFADFDANGYPGFFPDYKRWVSCFFYKDKLYRIEKVPEVRQIEEAKKKYIEAFGPYTKLENWENGISWLHWENKTTVLSIAYERKTGKADLIQYIDKLLRDELERREKKNPTRPKH